MSDPAMGDVPGSARGRNDNADRLKQYAIAAGAVATAVGGATDAGNAAVVMSSGSGPIWTATVNGANASISANTNFIQFSWGDALLDGKLYAVVAQRGAVTTTSVQRGAGLGASIQAFGVGRLASGAVIGGPGSNNFNQATSSLQLASSAWFGASWAAGAYAATAWNLGSSNTVRGFVAFRLASGSDFNYGYFDVEVTRSGLDRNSTFTMTIHGWAYESTLNQSITIGGAAAVPGGAGLAALAFGAAGLRGRRRGRN